MGILYHAHNIGRTEELCQCKHTFYNHSIDGLHPCRSCSCQAFHKIDPITGMELYLKELRDISSKAKQLLEHLDNCYYRLTHSSKEETKNAGLKD